jgi:fluoride exporter
MNQVLLVALGGAVGSVLRFGVGLAALRVFGVGLPWGTLIVNVAGGLAMGVLVARSESESLRLLLGVGLLGGFTTFSAFSLETVRLAEANPGAAALYVLASLVLSVGACWLGMVLGRL